MEQRRIPAGQVVQRGIDAAIAEHGVRIDAARVTIHNAAKLSRFSHDESGSDDTTL